LTELYKSVDSAIKAGKKLEEVVPPGTPGKTTLTLSSAVKNWTGKSLAGQVKDTWEEIVQKKPHGDIPH
jgi:hypothetical protein